MIRDKKRTRKPSALPHAEFREFLAQHSGDFFAIPLGSGYGFGRLKRGIHLGCYDLQSPEILTLDEIENASVLFSIPFDLDVIVTDRWKFLGNRPLHGEVAEPTKTYVGEPISGHGDIYVDGKKAPYAGEDMSKLERSAIWSPKNIEQRLRDHFAGRPNYHVELYKHTTKNLVFARWENGRTVYVTVPDVSKLPKRES